MRIRLSERDAEHFGCPRELEFDFEQLTGRDLLELEEQVGWTFDTFQSSFEGTPAVNAIGGPIYEMNGDVPKLDPMGKPIRVMAISTRTIMVMVWLCVRRANPAVRWESFPDGFTIAAVEIEDEPEGKAPANSRPSSTTTKPRSRKSSTSRRGT